MASLSISATLYHSTTQPQNLKISQNFSRYHLGKFQEKRPYFKHISSICRGAQIQEALDFLIEVDSENFPSKPEVYGEVLQCCVYERDFMLGQQIHAKIIKNGESLAKNDYVETKLLIFYCKCDAFEVAKRLFDKIQEHNAFSWAAIIGLYCRVGLNEEALFGFSEMQENGVCGDNFVLPNVLKACGALQRTGFGKGVHGYVLKMGFEDCVFVASSLIDMYGKCGVWGDARKVFDRMPDRNVVAWNSMISSYVQNGLMEEAIGVFYNMRMEAIEPTRTTIVSFLSASASYCSLEEGKQGHAVAILSGMELDDILGTSILNFYSKVGLVEDAELVFSRMVEKDTVTWNLLISCYVQHGQVESAIRLCCLMKLENFRYDCVTLSSILSGSAHMNNLKLGKEAHCYCIRNNLESDVIVTSSIVDMYAKCAKIDVGRRVFDSTLKKDLVLWNTLLASYAELGLSGETLSLFYQMQLEGVPPNLISWNSVILSLLKNCRVKGAMHIFAEMRSLGMLPNIITYTTLVTGLSKNGFGHEAIMLFWQMIKEGIHPNIVSIVGVLSACRITASLQYGRAIHGYVVGHNISLSVPLATSLVDMYAKCGNLDQAKKVFDMAVTKQLPLYNVMISGYALHGCAKEALALFKTLQEDDIEPDSITFTGLLSSCSHAGLVKEGLEIFICMISEYHVKPSIEHYGCVVNLLSRCGNLHDAFQLILNMPFEPDAPILGSLLVACREHNQIELGEHLAKYLTNMEPQNSGNYVALSNAYASIGRWDDMSRLRYMMKEKGLKKVPGCSWIQIGEELHVFVAGDRNHSQNEEIYATLALFERCTNF